MILKSLYRHTPLNDKAGSAYESGPDKDAEILHYQSVLREKNEYIESLLKVNTQSAHGAKRSPGETRKEPNRTTVVFDDAVTVNEEKNRLERLYAEKCRQYDEISGAFFWKITKPARAILDAMKRLKRGRT